MLIGERTQVDLLALPELAPKPLGDAATVVRDHAVGRAQDRLGRAVVLLELDDAGVREVVGEVEDVSNLGPAEAVDRLRVISHHGQVAVAWNARAPAYGRLGATASGQQLEQAVLGVVGVLVLVHENVPEARAVALADLLEQLQQVDRAKQEVVEVHRVHAQQVALIELVDVSDHLHKRGVGRAADVGGGAEPVLCRRDLVVDRGGRVALGVYANGVCAALGQSARIGLVVDRELPRVAEPRRLCPQDARAGSMKRHQPHPACVVAEQALHAPAHLLCGLVREGDGQDLTRLRLIGVDQERDPVREHPRLAAAGPRQDQQWALAVRDRLTLGLVQAFQQLLEMLGVRICGHLLRE